MQARDLVELAAMLAAHGSTALRRSPRISTTAMESYATAVKRRQRRWRHKLRALRSAAAPVKNARAWLEEILVSEALPRVWGAVLYADGPPREAAATACATRAVRQHAAARRRVLRILAGDALCVSRRDARELNQLRRSIARWIDLLVAHVQQNVSVRSGVESDEPPADVCRFGLEPQRAREFADDLASQQAAALGRSSLALAMISLRASLRQQLCCVSPSSALNHAVATSIMACFPADLFDATGPFQTVWAARLIHRAVDAERMVDQLLAE